MPVVADNRQIKSMFRWHSYFLAKSKGKIGGTCTWMRNSSHKIDTRHSIHFFPVDQQSSSLTCSYWIESLSFGHEGTESGSWTRQLRSGASAEESEPFFHVASSWGAGRQEAAALAKEYGVASPLRAESHPLRSPEFSKGQSTRNGESTGGMA